uniref:Uncharacterized protein n=1 Tax=Romanomermis culicivorax TaxID=13658 RepID=A0A915IVU4_ROMCU
MYHAFRLGMLPDPVLGQFAPSISSPLQFAHVTLVAVDFKEFYHYSDPKEENGVKGFSGGLGGLIGAHNEVPIFDTGVNLGLALVAGVIKGEAVDDPPKLKWRDEKLATEENPPLFEPILWGEEK